MNKKLLAIMIAATLLQGCTSFRQAENTRKDAVAEQQRYLQLEEDPVQHLFQHQERVDDGRDE